MSRKFVGNCELFIWFTLVKGQSQIVKFILASLVEGYKTKKIALRFRD